MNTIHNYIIWNNRFTQLFKSWRCCYPFGCSVVFQTMVRKLTPGRTEDVKRHLKRVMASGCPGNSRAIAWRMLRTLRKTLWQSFRGTPLHTAIRPSHSDRWAVPFCFCLSEAACALAKLRALFVGEVLKCCLFGKMAVGAYLHALLELGNDLGKILKAASPVDSAGS